MRKNITALFLAVVMAVTLLPTAFAAGNGYSDTQGHWGEDAIDRWSGYGVISGTGNGLFDPSAPLTRAQAAQIFANLLNLSATASVAQYTDVAVGSWYYDAIAKCVAAGILNGTGSNTMSPNTYVSREELFVMFARALGIQPQASAGVTFTDSASTASWAAGYVNALADMGVVGGSGDGTPAPKADIDRASVVALLDKAITAYGNTSGATVGSSSGIVLVVADNVTVMGSVETLVVAGGSAGISGSTVGTISVVGESASVSVGGSANVGQVSVTGANASVTVRGEATVSGVTIADTAQGAELTVSGDATVTAVDSAAQNVTISGDGTIEAATVSGDNTSVDTSGTDLTVSEGTTGVTENDRNVSAGDTVVTEPAEDTGSSGESTTPSRPTNPSRPSYDYYTVTFMLDENTVYDTQRVREGRTVEQPENPTKEGYSFGGWYLNGSIYDFTASVTGDITLTAQWIINDYTITLVNADTQVVTTIGAAHGAMLDKDALEQRVAVTGYSVTSWTLDGVAYDFTTPVTSDLTLVYTMQANNYTVTYQIADDTSVASTQVTFGAAVPLPTSTDTAYTWNWYTDSTFTTSASGMTMPAENITLYGQWTHNASGLKGHGTESDPFLIGTETDLLAINQLSDKMKTGTPYYFEQIGDIVLSSRENMKGSCSGDPCVTSYFCGVYDGMNYSLTVDVDCDSGFSGEGYNATYKNLSINLSGDRFSVMYLGNADDTLKNSKLVFEGLTFRNSGNNIVINNNYGLLSIYPNTGYLAKVNHISSVTVKDCTNYINFDGEGYGGVWFGDIAVEQTYYTFDNVNNYGNVRGQHAHLFMGNAGGYGQSGGYNDVDHVKTHLIITNSHNYGTMIGTTSATFLGYGCQNYAGLKAMEEALIGENGINATDGEYVGSLGDKEPTSLKLTVDDATGKLVITPPTYAEISYYTINMKLMAYSADKTHWGQVQISNRYDADTTVTEDYPALFIDVDTVDTKNLTLTDVAAPEGADYTIKKDESGQYYYVFEKQYWEVDSEQIQIYLNADTNMKNTEIVVTAYDAAGEFVETYTYQWN